MRIFNTSFLFLILLFSTKFHAQPFRERVMDSVMLESFNKAGYKQMTTTWSQYEGTTLTEIQIYDPRGLRTEHFQYNGYRWTRHKESFDSLKRKTAFIFFDDKDTALITSTHIHTYIDSLSFKEEVFNRKNELTETTLNQYKRIKDTLWITRTETYTNSSRVEKNLHRIIKKGDDLTISEFVGFDNLGKMKSLKASYYLKKKDKSGNITVTHGDYDVVIDESFYNNDTLYAQVLEGPEKYIQFQLAGKYPYKYGEEIISTTIYNPKGKLISSKDYSSKTNYTYDTQGKTIKVESFSQFPGEKEQKISEQIFYYDHHGLPLKVVETSVKTGQIITYQFEFK